MPERDPGPYVDLTLLRSLPQEVGRGFDKEAMATLWDRGLVTLRRGVWMRTEAGEAALYVHRMKQP